MRKGASTHVTCSLFAASGIGNLETLQLYLELETWKPKAKPVPETMDKRAAGKSIVVDAGGMLAEYVPGC